MNEYYADAHFGVDMIIDECKNIKQLIDSNEHNIIAYKQKLYKMQQYMKQVHDSLFDNCIAVCTHSFIRKHNSDPCNYFCYICEHCGINKNEIQKYK
jgi:signal-transduction protein with cAMP-binding, CBS, and nucleotidyltransferase domain